ncbi:type II toxin-antitoxin system PemK/MazF family toxin [Enterococcus rivorum]|uniref:Growth inhibitor PemK n=1 Tax=Enterococcus rivorum TaxID=762845 RepID=A0A1E5KZ16_9ENTE|nr:type II toxin-antitoxin system PemK/MazF family toxin [Enterococcus rivorum]MBP2097622.1 mRNA interferase MazF [Enterococcus rivorum]OEH83068.1 growth inhibitor PemK [Enterococcus rivorum]
MVRVRTPLQGDIILINLAPKKGHEQQGQRPFVCLSHKIISDTANIAVFAPISTTKREYPLYIKIPKEGGLKTTGKVLLDQLVTIDYNDRNCCYLETFPEAFTEELLMKVKVIFEKNSIC